MKELMNDNTPLDNAARTRLANLTSIVGIAVNVLLAAGKILTGFFSGSMSILADGINNLSDSANSVILLISFKMAARPADKEHPFGHGRAENIAALTISFIIALLGFSVLKSSVDKIRFPEPVDISTLAIVVLSVSIGLKTFLFFFYRAVGNRIASLAIRANAKDSLNDVITTSAVLIGLLITKFTSLMLDGYLGVLVSLFILYSAFELIKETISPLLGEKPDKELVNRIKQEVLKAESILGIHDIMIHTYGHGNVFASLHAEVDSRNDILKIHDDIDNAEKCVKEKLYVDLTIHTDPIETDNAAVNALRRITVKCLKEIDKSLSLHDFRVVFGETHHNLIFDIVVPFDFHGNIEAMKRDLQARINLETADDGIEKFVIADIDRDYAL